MRIRFLLAAVAAGLIATSAPAPAMAAEGQLEQIGGWIATEQSDPTYGDQDWTLMLEVAFRVPAELIGHSLEGEGIQNPGTPDEESVVFLPTEIGRNRILTFSFGFQSDQWKTGEQADAARAVYTAPLAVTARDTKTGEVFTGTITNWQFTPRPVFENVRKSGTRSRPVLSGRLTLPDGQPIAGLRVVLVGFEGGGRAHLSDPVRTDANGRFVVRAKFSPSGTRIAAINFQPYDALKTHHRYGAAYSRTFSVR